MANISAPRQSYIYGLCDPATGCIRYVGYSLCPAKRFIGHCRSASRGLPVSFVHRWMKDMEGRPRVQILEQTDEIAAPQRERIWIKWLKDMGYVLYNMTDGGDGGAWNKGLTKETDARVAKYAATMRGMPKSEEHKRKLRLVSHDYALGNDWGPGGPHFKGGKHTKEIRRKMSMERRGANNSQAKLTAVDVLDIRKRVKLGESRAALAREYNICRNQAAGIAKGQFWKHLEGGGHVVSR